MFTCYLGLGRLAVLEGWLPNSVTILDRVHCTVHTMKFDITAIYSDNIL